jgi:hypothetical protein
MPPDFRPGAADDYATGKTFILTTTKGGMVTLPKEVLGHLGLPHGGFLKVEYLPGGVCQFGPIHDQSNAAKQDNQKPASTKPKPVRKTPARGAERENPCRG